MNNEELKKEIEEKAGIPANLLTGETIEQNIAQAKALLALKREGEFLNPQTAKDQFVEFFEGKKPDPLKLALQEIEERAKQEGDGYPVVKDGGSVDVTIGTGGKSAKDQFVEFFEDIAAYDPRRRGGF